ncbi:hypothetical protein LXA47_23580 [Massilia sp. P8910]|nr:hypothetical protein [Massilia antarctica]MCE3606561.1 hypothetical protein [Massilia antarctica]
MRATVSVARTHARLQALGHLAQQQVARIVAEAVVDFLETVEVDEQQGQREFGAGRAAHVLLEPFAEQYAVGQAGQAVVIGVAQDLRFRRLEFGNIARRAGDGIDRAILVNHGEQDVAVSVRRAVGQGACEFAASGRARVGHGAQVAPQLGGEGGGEVGQVLPDGGAGGRAEQLAEHLVGVQYQAVDIGNVVQVGGGREQGVEAVREFIFFCEEGLQRLFQRLVDGIVEAHHVFAAEVAPMVAGRPQKHDTGAQRAKFGNGVVGAEARRHPRAPVQAGLGARLGARFGGRRGAGRRWRQVERIGNGVQHAGCVVAQGGRRQVARRRNAARKAVPVAQDIRQVVTDEARDARLVSGGRLVHGNSHNEGRRLTNGFA